MQAWNLLFLKSNNLDIRPLSDKTELNSPNRMIMIIKM